MDKLPFTVYDFFGYLASGFVLLVGLAAAFVGTDDWQRTPSTVLGLLLLVLAYSTGHVVANVSGYLVESKLVGGILGTPTTNLFRSAPPIGWRRLLPGYYTPLPREQREAVLEKARTKAGITSVSEGLFYHCFAQVKASDAVRTRLDTFLNLYGFCRNMTLALAVVGVALVVGSVCLHTAHTGNLVPPGWAAIGCIAGSIGLLYRYLKFFRHYSIEVFISYVELN
jgi:hypothetical protein